MKSYNKAILGCLVALLLLTGAALIYTRDWANYRERVQTLWKASKLSSTLVNTKPLDTADQLAPLAVSKLEKNYAEQALRVGDNSVDLAFSAALEDAAENPAPLTEETRGLAVRIKQAQDRVTADQAQLAALTSQLAKARAAAKDNLKEEIVLAEAQASLDQDELDDAHQDFIRAGGDKRATVQQQLDQHEASEVHKTGGQIAATTASSPEMTRSANVIAQMEAWSSLRAKERLLRAAQHDAQSRAATLSASHDALEKELNEEKAQRRILRKPAASEQETVQPQTAAATSAPPSALDFVKHLTQEQKNLASYDKRIEDEQSLASTYRDWLTLVTARKQSFEHGLLKSLLWILLIALCVFASNEWVQRFFADLSGDRRQLHTMQALAMFGLQGAGIVLILLVIFGVPNNFAAVAALAGAGLTIALKDFIVGFFGWFVLMGKDGIRPGDWVEINGIGGEVLEVGVFHTVLLETGSWADAGHPTGRKVTLMNSFAIEGHYFNFSTTGQWLWDELQVQVPGDADPYVTAEAIQKAVTEETAANARLAEQEWARVTPAYAKRSFSAVPSMSVRPSGSGINVFVRYITRANERHEVRSRLYRAAVDLLRGSKSLQSGEVKGLAPVPAEQK